MGGRGASSGIGKSSGAGAAATTSATGGGGAGGVAPTLQGMISAMQRANLRNKSKYIGDFHDGEGDSTPDFTNNNDPNLLKWQQTTDESKMAAYLAKLGKAATPPTDAEGYAYHQSPFQNMVINQNLNAPVYAKLNKSQFDAYCQQAGVEPIYRGWSGGQSSKDRFENAAASHTGAGMYGEGYYFGDSSTASQYGRTKTVAALSPNARVVSLEDVRKAMRKLSPNTRKAFQHSGSVPSSSYMSNDGESQMALKMGYNVIRTSWNYVILSRDAVVIRK